MLKFTIRVALVAVAGFALFYFELRTPGTLGVIGFLSGSLLLLVAFLFALVQSIRHWQTLRWRGLAAVAAIPLAMFVGREEGIRARDSRFLQWRLPVYSKVVERVLANGFAADAGEVPVFIELSADEREAAIWAKLWQDGSGKPVIEFFWAGTGPPPKHCFYVCVTAERDGSRQAESVRGRRVARGWYDVYD